MELLTRAIGTPKKDARYAYIAPFREQAKTVAWNYLKRYAQDIVVDQEKDLRESDLEVRLYNGSRVRLFGSDNPNALRGMYLDGVVLDEYADMRPSLWGEVIRPTLSDRHGWAVFIGTPRGKNAFYELIYGNGATIIGALKDPDWYHLTLKASETKILPDSELFGARKSMTENQYLQEYECSFEAAIIGAIFAKELKIAREAGRVAGVPYDGSKLVYTAWDIGFGDATAIWFYQTLGAEIRIIDYYEATGEGAAYYASVLRSKGYNYDTAYLPHDADNGQSASGSTFNEVLQSNGFRTHIVPKLKLEDGINAARMIFPRCVFDAKRCEVGLEALQNYRWDYNIRMGETKAHPVHDWSSHGADAFRYLAVASKRVGTERIFKQPIVTPRERMYDRI
jgi:phage terminase large subunit